jgi:hypothetical protein
MFLGICVVSATRIAAGEGSQELYVSSNRRPTPRSDYRDLS